LAVLPYIEQGPLYNQVFPCAVTWLTPGPTSGFGQATGFDVDNLNYSSPANVCTYGNNPTSGIISGSIMNGVAIPVFQCPSDLWPKVTGNIGSGYAIGKTNYLANIGNDTGGFAVGGPWASWSVPTGASESGVFMQSNSNYQTWAVSLLQIKDGTSNTVALGEVTGNLNVTGSWNGTGYNYSNVGSGNTGALHITAQSTIPIWCGGNPNAQGQGARYCYFRYMDANYLPNPQNTGINTPLADMCFGSQHTGGTNFVMCDGSVHFIADGISGATYQALGTRQGGETFDGSVLE
jgi:prepilin-type processing-associated H-X9-DG protein